MSDKIYGIADKAWQVVAGCSPAMPCAPRCWARKTVARNATSDTNDGGDDVFGWNDHVVFVLHSAQWIPAVKSEKVGQANKVATSDFSVPVLGGSYGYC